MKVVGGSLRWGEWAMLANWMLYCVAVGVLLGGGAIALERGLRALGRPTRWAWAAAMALTLALPIVARLAPAQGAPPAAASPVATAAVAAAVSVPQPVAPPAPKVRVPSLPA